MEPTSMIVLAATVVLALMAVFAGGVNCFLLRANQDPNVLVYTTLDDERAEDVLLVIKNVGHGAACNVHFTLHGELPRYAWKKGEAMT